MYPDSKNRVVKLSLTETEESQLPEEFPFSQIEEHARLMLEQYPEVKKRGHDLLRSKVPADKKEGIKLLRRSGIMHIMGLQLARYAVVIEQASSLGVTDENFSEYLMQELIAPEH